MLNRQLTTHLHKLAKQLPIIAIVGPRQSGKTTLAKLAFPGYHYVSLEDLDHRAYATEDPRGFLQDYPAGTIVDEAQLAPQLFSYLQTHTDKTNKPGQYILSGSQNFLLLEKISQSLAGRVNLLTLLPLSLAELSNNNLLRNNVNSLILNGFYPRLYSAKLAAKDWYPSYIQTYLERDVRQIKNLLDLAPFQLFLKMCAGRCGQLLNLSALANECGISHNTAKSWIGILGASYIIYLLQPYHQNYNKRLVKTPKLYFYDTGVACSLLGLKTAEQLTAYHLRGALFENFIISDMMKSVFNQNQTPALYFWRDKSGHEIDCIIEKADQLLAFEIKSGKTITEHLFSGLRYFQQLAGHPLESFLIYGGDQKQNRNHAKVVSWLTFAETAFAKLLTDSN